MSGKRKAAGAASSTGGAGTKARGRTATRKRGLLARLGIWTAGLTALLVVVGAVAFVVLYTTTDVPDPNADFQTETTFVYYRNGDSELGEFATQNRDSIDLADMPADLKDAVVAAENRTFWTDNGIDPRGIVRAAFSNAQGNSTQGASTITQQYVKILYLSQEQTLSRKAKEALLSLKIQRQQSKEEILEGYLNTIYFGRGAYGVEAASQAWFDIPAKDLNLRQSAFLASVLNNPGNLDPTTGRDNKRELRERYRYTLGGMVEMGTASEAEAETAAKSLPEVPEQEAESQYGGQRGHMLELVRSELNGLGFSDSEIDGGGLRVTTTFDRQVMDAAAEGVAAQRPEGFSDADLHIGVASVEPGTGALRGMYGGQDYLDSQLNWARSGGQAGSTMKAFAVAEGIDQGFALTDVFEGNSPYVLPDGSGDVENQGNTSYGSAITLEQAAEDSVNTAFIDLTLGMNNGPESIIERANAMGVPPAQAPARKRDRFGIPDESPGLEPVTGVALGNATVSPINMANGYATIAAEGQAAEVHVVERVEDADGNELYQRENTTEEALPADVAADTSYALQQVVSSGSGTAALSLGRPAAGKTGTATNGDGEVSSSWFVGYTPQLSTAVMYVRGQGNEELEGWLPEYFGGSFPARTWTDVMGRALEGTDVLDFPDPVFLDGDAPDSSAEVPTEAPETEAPAPAPEPEPQPQPQPEPEPEPERPSEEPTIEEPEPQPQPEPEDPGEEDPGEEDPDGPVVPDPDDPQPSDPASPPPSRDPDGR